MTTKTPDALLKLASLIDATTGPDRELDALIAVTLREGCRDNLPDDLEYLSMISERDHWAPHRKQGQYWFHCRSGTSMRTANEYTATEDGRRQTAVGLRLMARGLAA